MKALDNTDLSALPVLFRVGGADYNKTFKETVLSICIIIYYIKLYTILHIQSSHPNLSSSWMWPGFILTWKVDDNFFTSSLSNIPCQSSRKNRMTCIWNIFSVKNTSSSLSRLISLEIFLAIYTFFMWLWVCWGKTMSNAHASNHTSTITIVVFSYHCHDSNTDNNESHYCYYLLFLVYQFFMTSMKCCLEAMPIKLLPSPTLLFK